MATTTPIRICDDEGSTIKPVPVCNLDGLIVVRVDAAAAERLALAPNAQKKAGGKVIRKGIRKGGEIVRILLGSMGDDSTKRFHRCDPRRYTFLEVSDEMPQGVHTLRYLPDSTESLYRTVRTDCMEKAA
jgi:hypothetical protein